MPIVILLCGFPLLAGVLIEYLVCRLPIKKVWRWVPPIAVFLVASIVFAVRFFGWSAEHGGATAPLETLLVIPTLPAALVLAGLFAGYRLWRWRWSPKVIRDKKRK